MAAPDIRLAIASLNAAINEVAASIATAIQSEKPLTGETRVSDRLSIFRRSSVSASVGFSAFTHISKSQADALVRIINGIHDAPAVSLTKLKGLRDKGVIKDRHSEQLIFHPEFVRNVVPHLTKAIDLADSINQTLSLSRTDLVFVFGSNDAGRHGKGAALTAREFFGAIYGQGEGRQGRSYGVPTKDGQLKSKSLSDIQASVDRMIADARANNDLTYLVTRVGCGLAGFKDEVIAPMFSEAPGNCILPGAWLKILGRDPNTLTILNDIHLPMDAESFLVADIKGPSDPNKPRI